MEEKVEIGKSYKHFKGNTYRVLAIAKHSETQEDLVIYQQIEDQSKIWARPISLFCDTLVRDGKTYKRFTLINEL